MRRLAVFLRDRGPGPRAAHHPAVEAECLWHRAEALAILGQAADAIGSAKESAGIAARIGHA
ncbi:MAG: hypothetical protein ACRDP5_21905, partial [Streptosporangiaceae bacterium]